MDTYPSLLPPGAHIEGQVPERHLAGLDRDSNTRNELIARTLFRSKEIESYGSGMPRIQELCDDAGIWVEYRQQHDGTLLVFHRNDAFVGTDVRGLQSHGEGVGETVSEGLSSHDEVISETINETIKGPDGLSPDELAVVGYMAIRPDATYESVSHATGFSRAKVGRLIQGLRDRNVIIRVGARKNGTWKVVSDG